MFLVVNKGKLWTALVVIMLVSVIFVGVGIVYCFIPKKEYTVVIDAGHGGTDGGVFGVESGVSEAEVNLSVAYFLKNALEKYDIIVVMTREGKRILDGEGSKKEDFEIRKEIINSQKPNAVVSIHQNKFPDASRRGSQVFFNNLNEGGRTLANAVQKSLNEINLENVGREFSALKGDYYILNCSNYPSCIVECGFLSNHDDEKLLLDPKYREKLAEKIAYGVVAFISERSL